MRLIKCDYCKHYMNKDSICKYCNFEYFEDFKLFDDDWDIFKLDDDIEWSHLQIMYRLKAYGIDCLFADIWGDKDMAFIVGCDSKTELIANVLNLDEECVYNDFEHGLIILNLFKEKYLRGLL